MDSAARLPKLVLGVGAPLCAAARVNYELGAMDAGEWLRVLLKEAVKIPSALMFAYIRLRHGFTLSIVLHFIVNLSAFLLGAMA